jgi:sarcosine oxidase gamma subunit
VAALGLGPADVLFLRESFLTALCCWEWRQAACANSAVSAGDQSDAWVGLRIAGPSARAALCSLLAVDLHPRVLAPSDFVVTLAA